MPYRAAIFLGAFLLFALQPLLGRGILPLFGGGAGVWIACMLFFQVILLGGYAYAHAAVSRLGMGRRRRLHGGLLLLGLATLLLPVLWGGTPLLPSIRVPGAGLSYPPIAILVVLLLTAGAPLFVLSTTSPLVQDLFVRRTGEEPYRLYAVSNWGSLAGLLTYPLALEPWTSLRLQAWLMVVLFALYALLIHRLHADAGEQGRVAAQEDASELGRSSASLWLGLSALGTVWLLAVSNHLSTHIASMPLIWVLPLLVYLLTYILAFEGRWSFDSPGWRLGLGLLLLGFVLFRFLGTLTPGFLGGLAKISPALEQACYRGKQVLQAHSGMLLPVSLAGLFAGCLLAHGRLAALRPPARFLTRYYLMVSVGGCLGGLLVSLVAPSIFDTYQELPIAVLLSTLLMVFAAKGGGWMPRTERSFGALAFLLGLLTMAMAGMDFGLARGRDFYGTVLARQPHESLLTLIHGGTVHGLQLVKAPLRPVGYYGGRSGVARAILSLQAERPSIRVGVVGLGIGTLASYGRPGDSFTFFEISPEIIGFSGPQGRVFSVLRSTPAHVEVVEGDGRLALARRSGAPFDLILIDAFAGGHIPAHLLTTDALAVYVRQLKEDGLLVIHTTHHFPLTEQAGATLKATGLCALMIPSDQVMAKDRAGQSVPIEFTSFYWVAGRHPEQVFRPTLLSAAYFALAPEGALPSSAQPLRSRLDDATRGLAPWTDDRNALLPLFLAKRRED